MAAISFNTGGKPRTLVGNWEEERVLHVRMDGRQPKARWGAALSWLAFLFGANFLEVLWTIAENDHGLS